MPRRVHSGRQLEHGDVIVVKAEYGDGYTRGKRYVFLTRENLGGGATSRLKDVDTGEHKHVALSADDLRVYRVGHRDDGIPGFDDFELPFGPDRA
jgi:hypothetical protein